MAGGSTVFLKSQSIRATGAGSLHQPFGGMDSPRDDCAPHINIHLYLQLGKNGLDNDGLPSRPRKRDMGWGGGRGAGRFWHVYIAVSWVVLAILFTSMEREFMETHAWAFTAFASGVAILLLALGRADRRSVFIRWLSGRTVQWIGLRSYGLYLYHYPVFFFFEPLRVSGDLVNYVIVTGLKLIATFSIAEISWRYVELPLLTVKNRSMYASRKEGIMVSDRDSQRK